MDHHGLLGVLRTLNVTCHTVNEARAGVAPEWSWVNTPVIFPESRCVYCKSPMRSNSIWFLGGDRYTRLFGILQVRAGGKVDLIFPSHPHDTGSGTLCLGCNPTGIDLLATEPNLSDCPMGRYRVPVWYKRYWGHDCPEMREYLRQWGETDQLNLLNRI